MDFFKRTLLSINSNVRFLYQRLWFLFALFATWKIPPQETTYNLNSFASILIFYCFMQVKKEKSPYINCARTQFGGRDGHFRCRFRRRHPARTKRKEPERKLRPDSVWWLRELDLNQRPSGYEPDELPNCSIPRYNGGGKGIRTPAPLARPPGFQDRSLQPDLGIPPNASFPDDKMIITKHFNYVNTF